MVERGGDETVIWQSRYSGRNLMFGPNPERPRRVDFVEKPGDSASSIIEGRAPEKV